MTLRSDAAFYWRFGNILKFASTSWVAEPILAEARDEIESLSMHAQSVDLRVKCLELLEATRELHSCNSPAEQAVEGILSGIIRQELASCSTLMTGIKDGTPYVQAFG